MSDYPNWNDIPACVGTDTEEWFAMEPAKVYNNPSTLRRICSSCKVFDQCYEYAVSHSVDGWWANTTPRMRQQIRSHMGIEAKQIYISKDEL